MIGSQSVQQKFGRQRADWRFLLPSSNGIFRHLVLLGGSADLADKINAAGIAQRVSLDLPTERSADAIAILSNERVDLSHVSKYLAPGGSLYYEVDRRLISNVTFSPGQIRRLVQKSDLSLTGIYWAAPNFESCKRYIPLDSPGPLRWYWSTLFVPGTPLLRVLEILLGIFIGSSNWLFASIVPCFAFTAICGTPNKVLPSVLGLPEIPADLQSPDLHPVVLTSGQDDGSRAVMLPFKPQSCQPEAIIKISSRTDFNENTEREQKVLAEIRSKLDSEICRTIPKPLGLYRYGSLAVGIESSAAGFPLSVSSGRWRETFQDQVNDFLLAANWLQEFHRKTLVERLVWDDAAINRWIETALKTYAQTFGLTPNEERLFARVREHGKKLVGASLPIVWMHYDFGPWNLYRAADNLTVIDWEFGRNWERDRFGPALYDLLYFVTYWNHLVLHLNNEPEELRGFYRLFIAKDCSDKHLQAVHLVIYKYMEFLNMDRRFLPLVLVYLWIEQALHQFSRKLALGRAQEDARSNNRGIKYIDLLAQNVDIFLPGVVPTSGVG